MQLQNEQNVPNASVNEAVEATISESPSALPLPDTQQEQGQQQQQELDMLRDNIRTGDVSSDVVSCRALKYVNCSACTTCANHDC
jgi:hypothetical protein